MFASKASDRASGQYLTMNYSDETNDVDFHDLHDDARHEYPRRLNQSCWCVEPYIMKEREFACSHAETLSRADGRKPSFASRKTITGGENKKTCSRDMSGSQQAATS